jgi:YjbR
MVSPATFRQLALSQPDVVELPHFDKPSFRVKGKIFATLWVHENRAMIKLPEVEQSVFCAMPGVIFHPVPGYWGKQGATFVELSLVTKSVLKEAMTIAYNCVTAKKPKK